MTSYARGITTVLPGRAGVRIKGDVALKALCTELGAKKRPNLNRILAS